MPGREVIKHEPKKTVVEENGLGSQVLSINLCSFKCVLLRSAQQHADVQTDIKHNRRLMQEREIL
jgi:hypothetical protein